MTILQRAFMNLDVGGFVNPINYMKIVFFSEIIVVFYFIRILKSTTIFYIHHGTSSNCIDEIIMRKRSIFTDKLFCFERAFAMLVIHFMVYHILRKR